MTQISIVVPVLNDLRVGRSLDSIISQKNFRDIELIVIDGGSNESTTKQIEDRREHVDKFVSEPDDGIYDAMNKGIGMAGGDIIGILNSDDRYVDGGVLQDVVSRFDDPEIDGVFADLDMVQDNGRLSRRWSSREVQRWRCYYGWMPPHPTLFLRRSVYERFGSFNTQFRISADYEFMLRLIMRHRVNLTYIDRILVHMSPGGRSNGTVSGVVAANIEVFKAWRISGLKWGFLVPVLKPASKAPQFIFAKVASFRTRS